MLQSLCIVGWKCVQNGCSIVIRNRSRDISYFSKSGFLGQYKVNNANIFQSNNLQPFIVINSYATDKPSGANESEKNRSGVSTRKNKEDSPIITLIGTDNNPTVLSLVDAEKLAKRRDLRLVNVVPMDTKTQRPVYKLMTLAQYYEEEKVGKSVKKGGVIKGEKLLTMTSRITEHDLSTRLRQVKKWLLKSVEVRIVINGETNNMSAAVGILLIL